MASNTYRLRVPPKVPARQYWAVTVYDPRRAAFIREAPRWRLIPTRTRKKTPTARSTSISAPKAPAGKESNWIYTAPGRPWFTFFRFYGPEKAVFEKTWTLPDIEQAAAQ